MKESIPKYFCQLCKKEITKEDKAFRYLHINTENKELRKLRRDYRKTKRVELKNEI